MRLSRVKHTSPPQRGSCGPWDAVALEIAKREAQPSHGGSVCVLGGPRQIGSLGGRSSLFWAAKNATSSPEGPAGLWDVRVATAGVGRRGCWHLWPLRCSHVEHMYACMHGWHAWHSERTLTRLPTTALLPAPSINRGRSWCRTCVSARLGVVSQYPLVHSVLAWLWEMPWLQESESKRPQRGRTDHHTRKHSPCNWPVMLLSHMYILTAAGQSR